MRWTRMRRGRGLRAACVGRPFPRPALPAAACHPNQTATRLLHRWVHLNPSLFTCFHILYTLFQAWYLLVSDFAEIGKSQTFHQKNKQTNKNRSCLPLLDLFEGAFKSSARLVVSNVALQILMGLVRQKARRWHPSWWCYQKVEGTHAHVCVTFAQNVNCTSCGFVAILHHFKLGFHTSRSGNVCIVFQSILR